MVDSCLEKPLVPAKIVMTTSKPFTYEEALCIQIEGALESCNQANHELSTVMRRVHDYLKEKGKVARKEKGWATERPEGEEPPPQSNEDEEL